jgi:hypothetical protein
LQILFLHALLNAYLDDVEVDSIPFFEQELYAFVNKSIYSKPLEAHIRKVVPAKLVGFLLSYFVTQFRDISEVSKP